MHGSCAGAGNEVQSRSCKTRHALRGILSLPLSPPPTHTYTYNLSSLATKKEDCEFEASLGCTASSRPYLRRKKKRLELGRWLGG